MLYHRRSLQSLGTLLMVLLLLAGVVSPALSSTWTIAKVADFSSAANFFPDVVASPNGNFYAAYKYSVYSPAVEELKIIKWNGTSWTTLHTITPSAPGININNFGDWVWLIVQSESDIHLAFSGYKGSGTTSERGVHYGHYNGSAWSFDTVDVYTDPNGWKNVQYFNMAVDSANRPHLSIMVSDANGARASTLIHAVKSGSWTKTNVLSLTGGSELINYPAIAVDPSGKVHIAYEDASSVPNKLYVSTNATGTWTRSEIATELADSSLSLYDLRADSAGKLHATYIRFDNVTGNRSSYYATNASGSWTETPVPGSTGNDDVPRLSFNGNGVKLLTYLSFLDDNSMRNMVAVQNPGGSWVMEPASSATDIGYYIGSAINNSNQVMLVDQRDQSLWYATATISMTEVTSVIVPANGTYKAGQNLDFTLRFNEPVTVTPGSGGALSYIPITLHTGGTVQAAYVSGSGTSDLVFRYTVANGNLDPDGISLGAAVALNGGTIKNSLGSDATLTLKNAASTTGVLIDAVAPPAPVVLTPANGSAINDNTPSYSGTAEAYSIVTITLDGSLIGTTSANGSGSWVFTQNSALPDGPHTVRATAADSVGNTSPTSNTNTFTIDTLPPPAPVLLLPQNGPYTNDSTPLFSGTAEAGSIVTIIVDGTASGTTTADAAGNWSWTPSTALSEGPHTARATASDAVGNVSASSNTNSFGVDTVAPAAPVITSPANGSYTIDHTPDISGTAEAYSSLIIYVDGASIGSTSANDQNNWSFSLTPELSSGPHTVWATTTDRAGNISAHSQTNTFTIDSIPPATPVVVTPVDGGFINDSTPEISGTAEAQSTITINVDGATAGTVNADLSGNWAWSPTTPLAEGPHTVRANAADAAGNQSFYTSTRTFTVDTVVPSVTLSTSAPNPTNNATIPVVITFSEPVSGLTAGAITAQNGTVSGLTGSGASYIFTINPSGQGQVTVNLPAGAAHDPAGNTSQASNTLAVTYDSLAPALVSITRADSTPTQAATVHYTVLFSEPINSLAVSDFYLTTSGLIGASVQSITWDSGNTCTVTVFTGTGTGTLRLNLAPANTLADAAGNALITSGDGWQNGVYTAGEEYAVDRSAPAAELLTNEKLPVSGSSPYSFTVRFSDTQGMDPAQFVDGNIRLIGTGFDQSARHVRTTEVMAGKVFEVTYEIDAPVGGWETIPYQVYDLVLAAGQVQDLNGIFADQMVLGKIEKQKYIFVFPLIGH